MFLPNTTGILTARTGQNINGEITWAATGTEVPCGIVHLMGSKQKTSVRTDSSASRGNAEEQIAAAKILFPAYITIAQGDRFQIHGFKLEVTGIEPRLSVIGVLDHYEVDFRISTP